jgi:hypothetical protein
MIVVTCGATSNMDFSLWMFAWWFVRQFAFLLEYEQLSLTLLKLI